MSMNDDMTIYTEVSMLGQVFMGGYYDDSSNSFIISYIQLKSAYDTKEYSMQEFYERLNLKYSDKIKVEILNTTSTGRIKNIKINNKKFTGSEVYKNLNLRSTFFDIFL